MSVYMHLVPQLKTVLSTLSAIACYNDVLTACNSHKAVQPLPGLKDSVTRLNEGVHQYV